MRASLAPSLLLLAACSEPEPCDSSRFICDTAAYREKNIQDLVDDRLPPDPTDGTWLELVRLPGCLGEPDTFQVSVRIHGTTDGASQVDIWEAAEGEGFNEAHVFSVEATTTGAELSVRLRDGAAPAQYQPGSKTTYDCGVTDVGNLLTYAVRVYDDTGNLADCALFSTSTDPNAAIAAVYQSELPEPNPVAQRSQISPENCRTWTLPPG